MTTMSGFSSRSTSTTITQLPQRDEAAMSDEPGFSNSTAAEPVAEPVEEQVDEKVVSDSTVEDKAIKAPESKRRNRQS